MNLSFYQNWNDHFHFYCEVFSQYIFTWKTFQRQIINICYEYLYDQRFYYIFVSFLKRTFLKMIKFNPNQIYTTDSKIVDQLKSDRKVYDQEMQLFASQFDSNDNIEYLIVSTKFIKEWQQFTDLMTSAATPDAIIEAKAPEAMNQDLIQQVLTDFEQCTIKPELQEGKDFTFINPTINKLFQPFSGHRIPRKAYFHGVTKHIQVRPIKLEFVFMSCSWIQHLKADPKIKLPVLRTLAYKNEPVSQLLERLVQFAKKDERNRQLKHINNAASRMYIGEKFDPENYGKKIKNYSCSSGEKLARPGKQLKNNLLIGELQSTETQNIMIIELQEDTYVYEEPVQKQSYPFYKSDRPEYSEEEENKEIKFQFKQDSRRGLVGLRNVGNTCYMNSALQCMQHTKDLTQYFVNSYFTTEINENNPIGSHGKLLKAYGRFISSVTTGKQPVVIPSKLKYVIGKTKDMFFGYEQHDSGEFLLFMLDTLHEDLNRVVKKPYTDEIENQGRPDSVVAKESWLNYLKRNQSIINDLMGGQYRSVVKCPDCLNVSVTFDPFLIFNVPIPSLEAKKINLYCFFVNYNQETLKMTVTSKNNIAQDILEDIAEKAKVDRKNWRLFILGFNGSIRRVEMDESIDKLINQKQFNEESQERQLFALEFTTEEIDLMQKEKELVFKFANKTSESSAKDVLTFKRPFYLDTTNLKGSKIFDRVCEFLVFLEGKKSYKSVSEKNKAAKLTVLKEKAREENLFKIIMCYGNPKQIKNKMIFENQMQIKEDTNVTELLQKYKHQVEFVISFEKNPGFSFNSFKKHREDGKDMYGYSHGEEEEYSLIECMEEMKKAEKLVEGNEVFCSKCSDLKLAEKQMEMYKCSKYLILQLRRFKQIGYEKSKNYAKVDFPLTLDLADHIIDPTPPSNYLQDQTNIQFIVKPPNELSQSTKTTFHLYGVINHHGSLGGGHYTAYAKNNDNWYVFDDSFVDKIDPDKMDKKKAYLLFYERQ